MSLEVLLCGSNVSFHGGRVALVYRLLHSTHQLGHIFLPHEERLLQFLFVIFIVEKLGEFVLDAGDEVLELAGGVFDETSSNLRFIRCAADLTTSILQLFRQFPHHS